MRFFVIRVGGAREIFLGIERENADTCAAETLEAALELAGPDPGNLVEWGTVESEDPGAARLMTPPAGWRKLKKGRTA